MMSFKCKNCGFVFSISPHEKAKCPKCEGIKVKHTKKTTSKERGIKHTTIREENADYDEYFFIGFGTTEFFDF